MSLRVNPGFAGKHFHWTWMMRLRNRIMLCLFTNAGDTGHICKIMFQQSYTLFKINIMSECILWNRKSRKTRSLNYNEKYRISDSKSFHKLTHEHIQLVLKTFRVWEKAFRSMETSTLLFVGLLFGAVTLNFCHGWSAGGSGNIHRYFTTKRENKVRSLFIGVCICSEFLNEKKKQITLLEHFPYTTVVYLLNMKGGFDLNSRQREMSCK